MPPSPASRLAPGSSTGQKAPASTFKHKERHKMVVQSPSLPLPSSPTDHPVEVIGRIRDHVEGSERACMLQVLSQGQMIRVKTDQGYRDFGLDGVSLAEKENLQSFYEKYVESRIEMVKMGGRCTIMMYGPTGAGKSYTMFGTAKEPGIAYRALEKILGGFEQSSHDSSLRKLGVNVTILEIYNEEAFDLLASCSNTNNGHWAKPSRVRLEIMSKKVKNALSISGSDAEKISKEIAKVEKRRVVKSTLCNEKSSRSHCLVMVDVPALGGRLVLVDMAGSENLEQAGLGSESKLQTGKINQGNIALKRVVEAIANGDSYIPFRDSKLTMLLQDSFEDDESKILMILCASTDPKDMHKTIGTLEYGSKAKCIVRLPASPEKRKTNIDRLDLSVLEAKIQDMDVYISRLEAENQNKDREKEEIYKMLTLKDCDLVAVRKMLGQIEQEQQERCGMVHHDDCKARMESKLVECQRIADELIELGKRSLEEQVLEQQREIDMMRCRMEEIEREVQLLLKVNLQPGVIQGGLVPEEVNQVEHPSHKEFVDRDMCEDASKCSYARESIQACDFTDSLDSQICITPGSECTSTTCELEVCERTGWLPAIPEESEGEESKKKVPERRLHWDILSADNRAQAQSSIPEAPKEKTVQTGNSNDQPSWQESWTENNGLADELGKANKKNSGLTTTASRRSRIENIFMLCGNQRELIGSHSDSVNEQVEGLQNQRKDALNQTPMYSPLSYVRRPELQLPGSTEEPEDSARKAIVSPKCTPVHPSSLKQRRTTSGSSPVHAPKQSSSENTPPHGMPSVFTSLISKVQSLSSPRKLSFDGLSPFEAVKTSHDDTHHDTVSCEVFVKWEMSKDSCGKLIKILSMNPYASLAFLRKELELNVLEAKQDFFFLMLGDPSGAPVKRDNEVNLTIASLPDCHKKQGSKLACLRPHQRQGITASPLSPMENQISRSSALLCRPSGFSSDHLSSPETAVTCQIIDGALTPNSAETVKNKQKRSLPTSPLLKGLRL